MVVTRSGKNTRSCKECLEISKKIKNELYQIELVEDKLSKSNIAKACIKSAYEFIIHTEENKRKNCVKSDKVKFTLINKLHEFINTEYALIGKFCEEYLKKLDK